MMQTRRESGSRRRVRFALVLLGARADRTRYRAALVVIGCLLAIGGALLAAPAAPLSAASPLHVTDCRDNGTNTLRGKIASAAAGDTIVFDQNCTITLSTGPLALTKDVTIDGTGRTIVIDGGCTANCGTVNAVGGMQVLSIGLGVTVNLNALTIQHGVATNASGGGIDNEGGTLTVTNTTFSGNTASGSGGAIYSHGLSNFGGGATVINSTFVNNIARSGSGIELDALFGGAPILTVTNSTFTNNSDAIHVAGSASVTNSTITGNGRGIFTVDCLCVLTEVTTLTNSIVAGNSTDVGGLAVINNHSQVGGTPLLGALGNYGGPTQTFPLLPGSPAIGAGTTGAGIPTTDQRGVARTGHTDQGAFQSQGFTLTKTGGDNQSQQIRIPFPTPLTLTVAATAAGAPYHEPIQGGILSITTPSSGASATVSGNPASLPANGQVALHATANGTAGGPYAVTISAGGPNTTSFSLTNAAAPAHSTYTVGTTVDHMGGAVSAATCRTAGNTTCALRDAITYAASGTDTITFNATGHGTITLASANGPLIPTASVTITGPGATLTTVDGGCSFSNGTCQSGGVTMFEVSNGLTVSLSGLTIQHGNATITDPNDPGNQDGGAISNLGGNLTVTNCTVSNNAASGNGNGGAIYTDGGQVIIQSSTFTGNHAHNSAAISNRFSSGVVTLTNSTFTGNTADSAAGMGNNFGTLTVTNSTITGNTAGSGALLSSGGTLTIKNSIVAGNTPSDIGGGVRITSGGHNLFGTITGATITLGPGDLVNLTPLLGTLGNYGGPTQTIPLLPGSPAIGAGATGAGIPTTDQRGINRTGHTDIGAFQSQGFTLTRTSGNSQSIAIGATFALPLVVTVASTHSEPVNGGVVTFTGPASGAGIIPATTTATIGATTPGQAQMTAEANGALGSYSVTAAANGTTPASVSFSLTNVAAGPTLAGITPASGSTTGGASVTLTGANFVAGATVTFGGVGATNIVVVNGTTITVTAPAHAAGTVDVVVTTGGTTLTLAQSYTYGTVNTLPGSKPSGSAGGTPNSLPSVRPSGQTGGPAPNALPNSRP